MDPILLTYIISALILGLVIGFSVAKSQKGVKASSKNKNALDKDKLENEVLKDQVNQLNAKVKTLEKALELASQ